MDREKAQASILKWLSNWKPTEQFTFEKNCLWITGASDSGKSYGIQSALKALNERYHEVLIHGSEPAQLFQKRLKMKDVRYLCTCPVFLFDPFDSMLATEKGLVSTTVKILKDIQTAAAPSSGHRLIVFVGSTSVDKKMGDLKKLIPPDNIIVLPKRASGGNGLTASLNVAINETSTRDDVLYDTVGFYKCCDLAKMNQFLSQDPWLSPLTILDELRHGLRKKRVACSNLLNIMILWGRLCNVDNDHYVMGELPVLTTFLISLYLFQLLKDNEDVRKELCGESSTDEAGGTSSFTRLLTLHSVRKRIWKEKHDSGLPWMYDVHRRLGSKISNSLLN